MEPKKQYVTPVQKSMVIYPFGPTLDMRSFGISGDAADTGGDVKKERQFGSSSSGKSRNLWDEVW